MLQDKSSISCRICKTASGSDLMQSPCRCRGTIQYVHFNCLERWLNEACRDYCELCLYRFKSTQSRRYSLIRSLYIWISIPSHRTYLCYDLVITVILTALTMAILFICMVGAGVFIHEEREGLQDPFVRVVLIMFLSILLISYITTLYLIVQDHIKPWYHWWRSCVDVKLDIDTNEIKFHKSNRTDKEQHENSVGSSHQITETKSLELISCEASIISLQKMVSSFNIREEHEVMPSWNKNILCNSSHQSENDTKDTCLT